MVDAELSEQDRGLIDFLRGLIPEVIRQGHVPGLNVAVARRGSVIWEDGFGFADLASSRPMRADTVFRSGSMGKTYVSTAIMQLVEAGRIALDGPVSEYVGFEVVNPLGDRAVTVQDLLTHRSGLTTNSASSSFRPPPPLEQHLREDFVRGQLDQRRGSLPKWSAPPGRMAQYSNSGMALLGLIVQRKNGDGLTVGRYIEKHIMEPLGMALSCHPDGNYDDPERVPAEVRERLGTGYTGWGQVNAPTGKIYFKDFPAGLVMSIPGEHIKMLLAYLNGGQFGGGRILSARTVETMLSPRAELPGRASMTEGQTLIGLGWMMGNVGELRHWFGHGGAHMYGWRHNYRAYPQLDLAIMVATNRWDISKPLDNRYASELVLDLAAEFLADEADGVRRESSRSWVWKRSYAAGLHYAAECLWRLGIREELASQVARAVATGAQGGADPIEADAFDLAVRDFSGTDITLAGVERFVPSDACRLSRAELNLAWADLGGIGEFPLPLAPEEPAYREAVLERSRL
jgi:CubicO group peptidase (beta-lactamase class C family)